MTPNQILKKFRREREYILEQMAELLGLTRARLSQYENGDAIPVGRIREWSNAPQLPEWARNMAYQLWLATLEQAHDALADQLEALNDRVMRETVQSPSLLGHLK
jgi:transcriptional regulator with XRE-family HTH domain